MMASLPWKTQNTQPKYWWENVDYLWIYILFKYYNTERKEYAINTTNLFYLNQLLFIVYCLFL